MRTGLLSTVLLILLLVGGADALGQTALAEGATPIPAEKNTSSVMVREIVPASREDVGDLEKMFRERFEKEGELVNERLKNYDNKIESQNTRISDLKEYAQYWSALISALVVFVGFGAVFSARRTASKEINSWLKENEQKILNQLEKQAIAKIEPTIQNIVGEAKDSIEEHVGSVESHAAETHDFLDGLQKDFSQGDGSKITDTERDELKKVSEKSELKPESERTYWDWMALANMFFSQKNWGESAKHFDRVSKAKDATNKNVVNALIMKGISLRRGGDPESAIDVYDDIGRRLEGADDIEMQRILVGSLFNKGLAVAGLGSREDEIAVYDEIDHRFGKIEDPRISEWVAKALLNKSFAYNKLKLFEEVVFVCEEIERRFGESDVLEIREVLVSALINKGMAFDDLGRSDEAISILEEAEHLFIDSAESSLEARRVEAMSFRAAVIGSSGDFIKAETIFNEAIQKFGDSADVVHHEEMALLYNGLGFVHYNQAKHKVLEGESLSEQEQTVVKGINSVDKALSMAPDNEYYLDSKAYGLFLLGRRNEARRILGEIFQRSDREFWEKCLANSDDFTIPEDEDWKRMVEEVWAEVQAEKKAAGPEEGGATPAPSS